MTDITDQDRRDAREWAEDVAETFKYDDEVPRETRAAVNYILATVDAPEPTLAEELRGWESIFRNEGRSVDANSMRTLAARAEQIEQERDAARAEVARTDSARTQNYGDGSTLAGFLQKCVNIAHNIAAEYPSRPVKDHVIDLRWAADYAGRVEQERDDLARELAQALADAGLLAPDLPEPTDRSIPEWEMPNNEHHAVSVSRYGTVRIWGDTSGYTPAEAREVAAALLAAAAWAEQQ